MPANEPTYQSSDHKSLHVQVANQHQPEPVPTRWRTIRDSQLDIRNEQTTNLDGNYLERKHEESRRRAGMGQDSDRLCITEPCKAVT